MPTDRAARSAAVGSPPQTLVLTRSDVERLLDLDACIDAVERAFLAEAEGRVIPSSVLGTHVASGGFHVKAAGLLEPNACYAAKINANFPSNRERHGLPTIQGLVALFDAECGALLALMDSMSVTALRTAAATAVAARHLARANARVATIVGCGVQARSQLRALTRVRPIERVFACDRDPGAAARFRDELSRELSIEAEVVPNHRTASVQSDIVVTCTPSRQALLGPGDVRDGAFVAAVGADSEDKQEIEPALMARAAVVVDVLEQCAGFGDLHHALAGGVMRRDDVHATLSEVVSGRRPRPSDDDHRPIVFDSTGTALEDVAAALVVYERARTEGVGQTVSLAS